MRYWIISPFDSKKPEIFNHSWNFDLENGLIAISWSELGNPSIYKNINDLELKLRETYNNQRKPYKRIATAIWDFYFTIKPGDIVLARKGLTRIIGIGRVKKGTKSFYNKELGIERANNEIDYCPNFIAVDWKATEIELKNKLLQYTLVEITKTKFDSIMNVGFKKPENNTWVDDIYNSLIKLGGTAHYDTIEHYIRENIKRDIPHTVNDIIRGELERKSSDSKKFDHTEDLFYAVDGLGNGIWGVRDIDKLYESETLDNLRILAYEEVDNVTNNRTTNVIYRYRNPFVKAYTLKRANGYCEACKSKAPFLNKKKKPYLEVHHIIRLADDGPDYPNYVIALCPNCHRKAHFSSSNEDFAERLLNIVEELEN